MLAMEYSKLGSSSFDNNMDSAVQTGATQQLSMTMADVELLDAADFIVYSLQLFLDNRFAEAKHRIKPCMMNSIYHAAAHSFLDFMNGVLSFDKVNIAIGIDSLNKTIALCDERCCKWSLSENFLTQMLVRSDYNSYSEEELHSEVIKALCLACKASLTFARDESILSFIRGALHIRTSHHLFKKCNDALERRNWKNDKLKEHFESGVKLGLGLFNLILSSFPKRVLMLLEFVGFSGKRELGLTFLKAGHALSATFNGILCSLTILAYYVTIRYIIGHGLSDSELEDCEQMLSVFQDKYPKSTIVLFLHGRLLHVRGNVEEAIAVLTMAISGAIEWTGFHKIVYWELYYCNLAIGRYRVSFELADTLLKESSVSDCLHLYMKAAALFMCDDITADERNELECIMRLVPRKKQKIAGKCVPSETYCALRAERFILEGNWIMLPVLLMYMWNYFSLLHDKPDILEPIVERIDLSLADLLKDKGKESPFYMDNYCMALLLKGLCLNHMRRPTVAKALFLEICKNKGNIKEDHFLVSCAVMELGFMYFKDGKYKKAREYLEKAKINATLFGEFRIHQTLGEIKLAKKQQHT